MDEVPFLFKSFASLRPCAFALSLNAGIYVQRAAGGVGKNAFQLSPFAEALPE